MVNGTTVIAILLSLVYPGLGHIYLKRWKRAGLWAILWFIIVSVLIPIGTFQGVDTAQETLNAIASLGAVNLGVLCLVIFGCLIDSYSLSSN
jgi:drug/metabolite transporter (DMT)-like permease